MFGGVISLLSTVLSASISSAAPQPADRGTNLVPQSPPAQLAAATDRASIEAPVADVPQANTANTALRGGTSKAAQCNLLPRTAGPTNAEHAAGASGRSDTSVTAAAPPALLGDQVMTTFGPDRGTPTYCDASGGCDEYIARCRSAPSTTGVVAIATPITPRCGRW